MTVRLKSFKMRTPQLPKGQVTFLGIFVSISFSQRKTCSKGYVHIVTRWLELINRICIRFTLKYPMRPLRRFWKAGWLRSAGPNTPVPCPCVRWRRAPTQPILTARGLVFLMAPELEATRRVERSVRSSAVGYVFAKMGFQTILWASSGIHKAIATSS